MRKLLVLTLLLLFTASTFAATPIVKKDSEGRVYLLEGGFTEDAHVEMLTDGGLEEWTGDDLDEWIEDEVGSSVIEDETGDVHGGSHSAKFTIDASGSAIYINQSISYIANSWYKLTFWVKGSTTKRIRVLDEGIAAGGLSEILNVTTDWMYYNYTFKANNNSDIIQFMRFTSLDKSWYFFLDDISLYEYRPHLQVKTTNTGRVYANEFIELPE